MCLGAGARAANEAARRDYENKLRRREAKWMMDLSVTKAQHIQYEQGVDASNLGVAAAYSDIESKHKQLIGQTYQANEAEWKAFLQKNTGGNLEASGRTGRSIQRTSTLDLAEYLRGTSRRAYSLSQATDELQAAAGQAAGQARAQQMQMFTQVMFEKHPDIAPPKPVYQNEGFAMFQDALKIGASVATIAAAPIGGSATVGSWVASKFGG